MATEIKPYEFDEIERRFQAKWRDEGTFEVSEDASRPKFYCLEMLPYPSGDIHVGHVRNYCITDVITRFKRMRGFNVLHPIGWDALGLPAENAAIKRGTHPETWTRANIAGMKAQLQRLGFSYDWTREVATCDASYYRWNQWFFLKMLEKGIAYRANSPVNWCPSCLTVLANEQAEGGLCWRCKSTVVIRDMEQWFLRITDYQDALLDDMAALPAWPERVLQQQKNWVGRSQGAEVSFPIEGGGEIRVFTTRIDTIYGATFSVLAPEHPLVDSLLKGADPVAKETLARLRGQDRRARLAGQVEKEGLFTGRYATNPFSGERIPIWVGNFVLMGYGTGAIMAVPAHDDRDFEFARKYGLRVHPVIQPASGALDGSTMTESYNGPGLVTGSGEFNGLSSEAAVAQMIAHARAKGIGAEKTAYRLKDWLISRQRYWGTPIPVVYCEKDGVVGVAESDLPIVLPADAPFTGEGGNPLEKVEAFVKAVCPRCGGPARRETDTMDTFVDSSWYFYRYCSPKTDTAPFDKAQVKYWFPIDLYVGGIEHAILHLVYSRFWTKVMKDLGLIDWVEPVTRLFPQGMVHKDGEVMSKSKGNTIAPDDVIKRYGADTLRLYILFAAPPELSMEWSETGIEGPHRFLQRVWRLVQKHAATGRPRRAALSGLSESGAALRRKVHQTIARVTGDIDERIHLNTAVAALMELTNEAYRLEDGLTGESDEAALAEALDTLVLLLSPFAPHACEQMWRDLGHPKSLVDEPWPMADEAAMRETSVEVAVQVNGKIRARVQVPSDADEAAHKVIALQDPAVKPHVDGKTLVKAVIVPGRLINLVVK
ncbi:MAG TPA: leucine--tRNA ligase [Vicinamibacteria bacterium]|nr:leucine--tRNA ligase [Vicinamibacteria bacterium]